MNSHVFHNILSAEKLRPEAISGLFCFDHKSALQSDINVLAMLKNSVRAIHLFSIDSELI